MTQKNDIGPQRHGEEAASQDIDTIGLPATLQQALEFAANADVSELEDALYGLGYLERVLVECSGRKRVIGTDRIVRTGWAVTRAEFCTDGECPKPFCDDCPNRI